MSQDNTQIYDLGKVFITTGGTWDSADSYERLTIITYEGSSYISVQDVEAGTDLTNVAFWQVLALKGDAGTSANDL